MGLHIEIYKPQRFGDCTNGGVTSKNIKGLCITNVAGPFDPCELYPAAELVKQTFGHGPSVKIVPTEEIAKKSWCMFGGHYGATSDSRFGEAVEEMLGHGFYGALPIHDRVE